MSRTKKSRRLKDKLDIKTGSKKNFIERGQKGRIPSKNKLAKHTDKLKSAFKKHLEEQENLPKADRKSELDAEDALSAAPAPFSRAAKQAAKAATETAAPEKAVPEKPVAEKAVPEKPAAKAKAKPAAKAKPVVKEADGEKTVNAASKKTKPTQKQPAVAENDQPTSTQPAKEKPRFDQLSGDDLWDLLDD